MIDLHSTAALTSYLQHTHTHTCTHTLVRQHYSPTCLSFPKDFKDMVLPGLDGKDYTSTSTYSLGTKPTNQNPSARFAVWARKNSV
eukprot:m.118501 g.118501  ORF g.118501 m.118501 type:complete len:86 (+) comp21733_c0_seq1:1442-1699(+)